MSTPTTPLPYVRAFTKSRTSEEPTHTDFGLTDNKGRACGMLLSMRTRTLVAFDTDQGHRYYYNVRLDLDEGGEMVQHGYHVHGTRDGASFGPTQDTKWFATPEEAAERGALAVQNAKKRRARNLAA